MSSLFERLLGSDIPNEQAGLKSRQRDADETLRKVVEQQAYAVEDCGVTGVGSSTKDRTASQLSFPSRASHSARTSRHPTRISFESLSAKLRVPAQASFKHVFVRHYDSQFTFDGDELFEAETCHRILLTDALIDQYATEPGFSLSRLRDAVLAADDVDDEIAPVTWGECRDYSQTDDAAIAIGGAAAAAGASASAASCAGAGAAAGGGGGAC